MNYLAIALVIIIIIILYSFFSYVTNNALVAGLQKLNTPLSWTFDKLLNPTSTSYSYQCWLFITSAPTSPTPIFYRGSASDSAKEFEVYLDTNLNLTVKSGGNQIMQIMGQFPLQKWVYLVINVSQKNIEAYINGKLTKTVNSTNLTTPTMMGGLTIGHVGLSGNLTKFYRLPKVLDAKTVQAKYLSGNGLNNAITSMIPYGLNFTITNGQSASRVVKIF
jgi:hypothetical protein